MAFDELVVDVEETMSGAVLNPDGTYSAGEGEDPRETLARVVRWTEATD